MLGLHCFVALPLSNLVRVRFLRLHIATDDVESRPSVAFLSRLVAFSCLDFSESYNRPSRRQMIFGILKPNFMFGHIYKHIHRETEIYTYTHTHIYMAVLTSKNSVTKVL